MYQQECPYMKILSSMPLTPGPDALVEETKGVHLRFCVWLNARQVTLPSLNMDM